MKDAIHNGKRHNGTGVIRPNQVPTFVFIKRSEELSVADVAVALYKCGGFISIASRLLDVPGDAIQKLIARSEELQEIVNDIRESYLDLAEDKLIGLIKGGNLDAIKYFLNYKGGSRGYGIDMLAKVKSLEKGEQNQNNISILNINGVMEALAASTSGKPIIQSIGQPEESTIGSAESVTGEYIPPEEE